MSLRVKYNENSEKNIEKSFDYVWNIINGAAGTKTQYSYLQTQLWCQ